MPLNDPKLTLNCPACGERVEYGTSTSSGGGAYERGGVFQTVADAHDACLSFGCRRFWKFGPGSGLVEDLLQLAEGRQRGH